jgi:hypothetical protein
MPLAARRPSMPSGIQSKFLAIGMGAIAATVAVLVGLGAWQSSVFSDRANSEAMGLGAQDLSDVSMGTYRLVEAQAQVVDNSVATGVADADYLLQASGGVSLSPETVTMTAVDQNTKASSQVVLPKMLIGKTWVGQVTP